MYIDSKITVKCYLDRYWSNERFEEPVIWIENMLIPKIIGTVKKGFVKVFKRLKQLPLGHRYHGYILK